MDNTVTIYPLSCLDLEKEMEFLTEQMHVINEEIYKASGKYRFSISIKKCKCDNTQSTPKVLRSVPLDGMCCSICRPDIADM